MSTDLMSKTASSTITRTIVLLLGVAIGAFSCKNQSISLFKPTSEREHYIHSLEQAGLSGTKAGRAWVEAGTQSLEATPDLEIPASVSGVFKAKTVEAKAWKLDLQRGASLDLAVDWNTGDSTVLFVDLIRGSDLRMESFEVKNEKKLSYEADEAGVYFLRLQPELLGEGNFQVNVSGKATYALFPVMGKDSKAIQSFWGANRDGGRRSHEGVDIFAARGTPVLAPVAGRVTSVKETGIGGKQVWVRDSKRGWNLYFAHLDSQAVSALQGVNPGDTLGFVGNTGNARTTPPHLHFGIYQRGAMDPFPVINDNHKSPVASALVADRQFLRVTANPANLRNGPGTSFDIVTSLNQNTPVMVEAVSSDWYQVRTPEGITGFLFSNLTAPVNSDPLEKKDRHVFIDPFLSPGDSLLINLEGFEKLGSYLSYDIIRDIDENLYYLPWDENIE